MPANRGRPREPDILRPHIDEGHLEELLGLDSSKIGFYAEVKQKIQELEATNLDLEARTNELQTVFDSIGDGVAIFDAQGVVRYRNHVWPHLFPGETVLGKSCAHLFHPDRPRAPHTCPVEAALQGERRTLSFAETHGGRTRYFEAAANPIAGPGSLPRRALLFVRDVTERRLQEIQLRQTEKMSSIGVLAAGVAHEINNPLASVAWYAEALLRRRRDSPDLAQDARLQVFWDYLAVIMREAHRCKGITDSLLSFSRRSDGEFAPVDLNPLVGEVVDLVGCHARQNQVEIVRDLDAHLPRFPGDAASLRQVILNLTLNALQAIEEKGTVRIATCRDDPFAVLRVRDDGCGVEPEHLDQIFDPFFTTKSVGQGLGLGLSVTYNIVRRHGGEIAVESERGNGTTFTVRLPLRRGGE